MPSLLSILNKFICSESNDKIYFWRWHMCQSIPLYLNQWRLRSENGKSVDNFANDFGGHFDYSSWFDPSRMTVGPSSPPRFSSFLEFFAGSLASSAVLHIPWGLHNSPRAIELSTVHQENPSPPLPLSPGSTDQDSSMAYVHANPAPFIPRGLNRIEVQARKPAERVVLMRPRPKNHDLAIATIHPLPQQQVSFQAIRNVLGDFLTNVKRTEYTDMQPTHLGQAFVRFRNMYDRDRLIDMSPF